MATVTFRINGVLCTVGSEVSSGTTLLDYIRDTLELRGTKYLCLEGGCGACIVSVERPGCGVHAVNSCLVSVPSCHNWNITTIEGIGNRRMGYHLLQKTLADNDGTQCGYCSTGWVMAVYSLLKSKKLSMLEIERSLASNMCRCTAYRPILDAFKKFGTDAPPSERVTLDIEDLDTCHKTCTRSTCDHFDWCFVNNLNLEDDRIHISLNDGKEWFKALSTADVFNIWNCYGDDSYMLVAGNTGKGVVPIVEYPRILIDISEVSELKGYSFEQNLVVGAGNTLTELLDIFGAVSQKNEDFDYLNVLSEHVKQVAHIPVQNMGTVAGNLMVKHGNNEFTSDIFLILETVGAALTILPTSGVAKVMSLQNFLKEDMRCKIIYNVLFPPLSKNCHVVTYKVMKRSQNADAIVNAGFVYTLDALNNVLSSRIVFSGLRPGFTRASDTERCLVGKSLFNNSTLQTAIQALLKELLVEESSVHYSVEYRKKLAVGLFYKSLLSLCPSNVLNSRNKSGAVKLHQTRGLSSGKQEYSTDSTLWPINQPLHKVEGLIQCAGEALYTEDEPTLPNQVYAAFVLGSIGLGKIQEIDPSKALATRGVLAFYTAEDIPGRNSFTSGVSGSTEDEELLSNGNVKYFHQPVGIVVAETKDIAQRAVNFVKITYSEIKTPVVDVKEAKKLKDKVTLAKIIKGNGEGKDIKKVICGSHTIYGQYHFCYETLVCVSRPTEEGLSLRSATQGTDSDQVATARCLNIDQNSIDVEVRRCGGGFGLKITRGLQVAVACGLVTHKLKRPCRFILPLRTAMRIAGKRLSASIDYEVGVNGQGIIQFLNYDLFDDNGCIVNEQIIALTFAVYYNCYPPRKFNFAAYNVVTDKASNSFCRSPGSLETITTTETILERISYELNIDPVEVRLKNVDTKYIDTIKDMLEKLKVDADVIERRKAVDNYNAENRWKKRGLRLTFMRWSSKPDYYSDVNISILHGDGTVVISHGGVEIGQGINTKLIQICAYYLNISINKVKVKTNDTTANPNASPTVGSATSQTVAIAVKAASEDLVRKLKPLKIELNNPPWEVLITRAYERGIDLQSHGFVNTSDVHDFDVYGITLAEVEIDILTGEWTILRVDLLEDVGRTINPLIDVGQVEGAFIMGVGYFTTEDLIYDPTGELKTDRSWSYKIPQALDIPIDFRVYFRSKPYKNDIVLGSKATGEPATVMSVAVPFAMREAIVSARGETGIPANQWFQIDGPFTVEKICLATCTDVTDFKFY